MQIKVLTHAVGLLGSSSALARNNIHTAQECVAHQRLMSLLSNHALWHDYKNSCSETYYSAAVHAVKL